MANSSSVKYAKNEGWCSRGLLKNYLYIFNFLFLIGGVIVFGVGIYSILAEHRFISLLSSASYPLTSYLLAGAGALVFISAVLGCCGIKRSNRFLLLIYILSLLIVFLLEAKAGILAFVYREHAYRDLEAHLSTTFKDVYGIDEVKTQAVDDMQNEFKCCGSESPSDWKDSRWLKDELAPNNIVPDSCCKTPSFECGRRDHPNNIYFTGCIHRLSETVQDHLGYLAITGLGFCILQIIGIIFSLCLYVKLREPEISDV